MNREHNTPKHGENTKKHTIITPLNLTPDAPVHLSPLPPPKYSSPKCDAMKLRASALLRSMARPGSSSELAPANHRTTLPNTKGVSH